MSESGDDEREYVFTIPSIEELQSSIRDESAPIAKRMRTVFLLKQIGDSDALETLNEGLHSQSVLLGHECAYALGQMQNPLAVPWLTTAVQDKTLDPIVRHECVEALANIGAPGTEELISSLCDDPCSEVSDTAIIAIEKIRRAKKEIEESNDSAPQSKYYSVDPAPPLPSNNIEELQSKLNDRSASLYDRYRAMFTLRNIGSHAAIDALASSLDGDDSPVFRHEIAYVLGQIADPHSLTCLKKLLANKNEHAMVRHEAAEAIGAIAEEASEDMLRSYLDDNNENIIVKESCHVALDLVDYWNNDDVSTALEQEEENNGNEKIINEKMTNRRSLTDDIPLSSF